MTKRFTRIILGSLVLLCAAGSAQARDLQCMIFVDGMSDCWKHKGVTFHLSDQSEKITATHGHILKFKCNVEGLYKVKAEWGVGRQHEAHSSNEFYFDVHNLVRHLHFPQDFHVTQACIKTR